MKEQVGLYRSSRMTLIILWVFPELNKARFTNGNKKKHFMEWKVDISVVEILYFLRR
jgi:hypothetical protein